MVVFDATGLREDVRDVINTGLRDPDFYGRITNGEFEVEFYRIERAISEVCGSHEGIGKSNYEVYDKAMDFLSEVLFSSYALK
jgi:hypothetical protein